MQRLLHFFIPILLVLFAWSCVRTDGKEIDRVIEQTKSAFAPDKRTAIFHVGAVRKDGQWVLEGEVMSEEVRQFLADSLEAMGISFLDSILVLPAPALGDNTYGIVRLSVCNIRAEPRHSAEMVTQELLGNILRVWKASGEWYYVQTPDGYLGWVDLTAFYPTNEAFIARWKRRPKFVVTHPFTQLLEWPEPNAPMVMDLVAGNILAKDRRPDVDGYRAVLTVDGRSGFVGKEHLVEEDSMARIYPAQGTALIGTAQKFLGIPYLWGGTSPKGFDCSGYTQLIYALHGIDLQRDASMQVAQGRELGDSLALDEYCPGDLLFFGRHTEDGRERVTHVALYLGDGKIIHAAGEVRVQSLDSNDADFAPDRFASFLRARRILADESCNQEAQSGN